MSNLALSAAPFSSNNEQDNLSNISNISNMSNMSETSTNAIDRVRKRTIKKRSSDDKVTEMMSYIHKNLQNDSDESEMDSFKPPPPPTSIGAERRKETDPNLQHKNNTPSLKEGEMAQSNMAELVSDDSIDTDAYGKLENTEPPEYYKKLAPLYKQDETVKTALEMPQVANRGELNQKLNYMIHLLEEQHDERTGHVFEELILYSFLGIFIIFVVDSFAKAGKYVR